MTCGTPLHEDDDQSCKEEEEEEERKGKRTSEISTICNSFFAFTTLFGI